MSTPSKKKTGVGKTMPVFFLSAARHGSVSDARKWTKTVG